MFKYSFSKNDSTVKIFLTLYKKNTLKQFAVFQNIIHFILNQPKLIFTSNLISIDLNQINTKTFLKNNLNFIYYTKTNPRILTYVFTGIHSWISQSLKIPSFEWYERELIEQSSFIFYNLVDTRNLLQAYLLKITYLNNLKPNKYNWVFTNLFTKKTNTSNSLRIIL